MLYSASTVMAQNEKIIPPKKPAIKQVAKPGKKKGGKGAGSMLSGGFTGNLLSAVLILLILMSL